MSENKYRDYLSDDQTFHRRYLKDEDEPVGSSSFSKFIMGATATVGLAAGTAAAYRKGAFKGAAGDMITAMGKFRGSRLGNTLDSVRNWTKDDKWDDIADVDGKIKRTYARAAMWKELPDYLARGEARYSAKHSLAESNPIIQDKPFELAEYVKQMNKVRRDLEKDAESVTDITRKTELLIFGNKASQRMEESFKDVLEFSKEQQANMLKRTGYQQATLRDVWNHMEPDTRGMLKKFEDDLQKNQRAYSIMDKVVDQNILVRKGGEGQPEFADLRDFKEAIAKTGNTFAEDFTTPFIKINPLRMFYLNEFTKNETPKMFANMSRSKVQPFIEKNMPIDMKDSIFINGRLNSFDHATGSFTESSKAAYLVNAKNDGNGSLLVRASKNMMNVYDGKQEFVRSDGHKWLGGLGFRRNVYEPLARKMDFGFQNTAIETDEAIGDLSVYGTAIGKFLHEGVDPWKGIKPYKDKKIIESTLGDGAEYMLIPRYKTLKEMNAENKGFGDYSKQFYAGRNNPEDVTTASFFGYTFAERLNATISQMGFGLNAKHLGSPQQILWQLSLRRALPVVGAVEGYKALNHLGEQVTGEEPEDAFATAFIGTQMDIAKAAEKVGFTDWAKDMVKLMPGVEFLAELPLPVLTTEGMTPITLKDLMPLNKTAEELEEYYENGEEVVRKGRYWETGNTPLTGGKAEYYQPNWYKRITSDWEYTENMWGSKEEYWKYHPKMPILDMYHWEKKHYEDRPYQLTGGAPMIEEVPLIGPLLNSTIGQIIKPQQAMHSEEWNNPGYYQKQEGFQLAQSLGLLESTMGGASAGGVLGAHTGSSGTGVALAATAVNQVYGGVAVGGVGGGGTVEYDPGAGRDGIREGQHLAYVTSGGNVSIMMTDEDANLKNVNYQLREAGIGKTGVASMIRMEFPELTDAEAEKLANPAGINIALGNLKYNTTELGGFYGWMGSLATKQSASQYAPRIETSSEAYGFNRQFWDSDYGNMGADAMEIFRRFVPRDAHKNYVNTIDNNMPTWMPGPEYFTDYQHGDPYVKVKKGEMRLPGQAYERLYNVNIEDSLKMDIGASLIGYDQKKMIDHWLHKDDVNDAQKTFVTERGTDWHKEWEAEMVQKGVVAKKEEGGDNDSSNKLIDEGSDIYKNYYMEQKVENKELGINGYYDILANHKEGLEWMQSRAVDFTYYKAASGGTGNSQEGFFDKVDVGKMSKADQSKFYEELMAKSDRALIDPKTRTHEKWKNEEMHFENVQQVNFYASEMKTPVNYIIHVDMENPDNPIKIFGFEYNEELLQHTTAKVQGAREAVNKMMEDGAIGRGDFYRPIDRYRILADTAPYSEEFRKLKAQLSMINLDEEEKAEIQIINDQVSSRKEHARTYDYRYKTADVEHQDVTITKVIDNNTFLTEEFGDNPLRLAGVYVPTGDDERGLEATKLVRQYLREGNQLRVSVNKDEANRVNNDTYSTISAVIRAGDISNLNRELIQKGLAKERTNDWSATGVHARFSDSQIKIGSAWESFAHLDTPFHTKLLQVRSPLEQYKRREVYGKDWQDWADPIDDFITPWYQNWISKSPIAAITLGTFMGSLFGAGENKGRYGRVMGALIGGTASALGVGYVKAVGLATGEKWKPERREKERDVEEYFDMLKYVKYKGLYEQAADEANKREGFDVRAFMKRNQMSGDHRKTRLRELKTQKQELMRQSGSKKGDDMKVLNKEINELMGTRKAEKITPIAAQAIQYYQESEKTMYAYDSGDPLANILSAVPRKERLYLNKFLAAPEEERDEILEVVPDYIKRVLQSMWGLEVDPKPEIYEYFSKHALPTADWEGWDPRANLSDIKLRVVKREGMDLSEFNMWHEDEQRANQIQDNQIPKLNERTNPQLVRSKLQDILGKAGFRNLNVEIEETKQAGLQMEMNVRKDRREDVRKQINDNGYSLIQ
jgi:endonuclease YncB( thermonuclease family)